MRCIGCGYDGAIPVLAGFSFFVECDSKSDNGRTVNAGASRWAYAAGRRAWAMRIRFAATHVPIAMHRRRLTITRTFGGRQKHRDHDNLVTSYKPAVDALVSRNLLLDDSAKGVDGPYYHQERGAVAGTTFLLEDLAL